jgi:hypothetical protein
LVVGLVVEVGGVVLVLQLLSGRRTMGRRRLMAHSDIESIYPISLPRRPAKRSGKARKRHRSTDHGYRSSIIATIIRSYSAVLRTALALLAAPVVTRDLHRPATPGDDDLPTSACRPSLDSLWCSNRCASPNSGAMDLIPSRVRTSGTYIRKYTREQS